MKNKRVLYLVQSAVIAALYIVLTYTQEFLLPGTTSMAVQFRLSEILCMLCVFTPAAIPGLTVGCVLSNIVSAGVMPLDIVLGSLATLLSSICMYKLRNIRLFSLPVLSSLMPAIFNGVIIGLELELFVVGGFHLISFLIQGGLVGLGELVVCTVAGLPFSKLIEKMRIFEITR